MSKLEELARVVKAGGIIELNPHQAGYEKAEDYLKNLPDDLYDEVGTVDYSKDIWTVHIYPRTPVGFIAAVSNDIDALLDWAIAGARDY